MTKRPPAASSACILLSAVVLAATPLGARSQDVAPPAQARAAAAIATPETPPSVPIDLTPDVINAATFDGQPLPEGASPIVLKLQVLLDRAGFSPGVIDGVMGGNVGKAITAAEFVTGLPQDGLLDADVWAVLQPLADAPVIVGYEITPDDLAGPFVPDLPSDYGALAKLPRSAWRTPLEMLAERFHMDEDLLARLNPGADFARPGTVIAVTATGGPRTGMPVTYLIADKGRAQLLGYGPDNRLVVSYPATIGSSDNPSPSGTHLVNEIVPEAAYYYRPEVNFQQGDNTEPLTIPPGPNNPIGTTWIDLSEPTYGIHGTPDPSKIDKTASHGCIRLTNWDAEELAALVTKGVPVEFR